MLKFQGSKEEAPTKILKNYHRQQERNFTSNLCALHANRQQIKFGQSSVSSCRYFLETRYFFNVPQYWCMRVVHIDGAYRYIFIRAHNIHTIQFGQYHSPTLKKKFLGDQLELRIIVLIGDGFEVFKRLRYAVHVRSLFYWL